jgi:hypothetical protein
VATGFQVTFDALDPEALSRFWAQVLGYVLQPAPSGFGSWDEFLRQQGIPEERWNDASAIVDPDGAGPRVYFQRVPEAKSAKNRVHLDVNISVGLQGDAGTRRVREEAERIVGLGATQVRVFDERDEYWIVMQDPEGNEFCVQ